MAAILGCGALWVCGGGRGAPSFIADDSSRPLKTTATLDGGLTLLECPLAESQMRLLNGPPPVLSIVVPSYHRGAELVQAVTSLADQLTGGLERKVEIIISDNDSEPNTVGAIRGLAEKYATVSYLRHARDEGGFFQFFAAPWRARGKWTWVFGSDDVLLPGGVAHVVTALERERPSFMALNKRVFNADLSQEIAASFNSIPDRRFDTFEALFYAIGIQPAFISGNIELTEAARAFDPQPYLTVDTRHPHLAAFLEKHHGASAFYCSAPFLVHRVDNSGLGEYHVGNFFDFAVTFPALLSAVVRKIGGPADFFERMTGEKRIASYEPTGVTFVDSMFENLLRLLAGGRHITPSQRYALEQALAGCRADRVKQLGELWAIQMTILELERRANAAKQQLEQNRLSCTQASQLFTKPTG
jgi:glycosyltransferase involved in cell wall biosynthesis